MSELKVFAKYQLYNLGTILLNLVNAHLILRIILKKTYLRLIVRNLVNIILILRTIIRNFANKQFVLRMFLIKLVNKQCVLRTILTNLANTHLILKIILRNYCIEGIEMRQLGFKVRRLLFLNHY